MPASFPVYYSTQFTQNESTNISPGCDGELKSYYAPLEHTPAVAGTLTGTVYDGEIAIQTFYVAQDGGFHFSDIGTPPDDSIKAISEGSSLDLITGEMVIQWNGDPGQNYLVLSYEWSLEVDPQNVSEYNIDWDYEYAMMCSDYKYIKHADWSKDGF